MKIIAIALKDMTQYFRSMIALVMMFAVPILLVGMFYIMFGGNDGDDDSFEIPVTNVIVVNQDSGEMLVVADVSDTHPQDSTSNGRNSMGALLTEMLQADEFSDLMYVRVMDDAEMAKNEVDQQEAGVALIIPENFSDSFTNPDEDAIVEFYRDPGLTIGPDIVKGVLQQFMDGFSSSQIALQVTFEQLINDGFPIDDQLSQGIVGDYFDEMLTEPEGQDAAVLLNVKSPSGEEVSGIASAGMISMMMTGMTVFYVFFTGASTAQSLLTEDIKGTLGRLFTTPTPKSNILGGKFLSGFFMILVQITVLMLFGNLVFNIDWGRLVTLLPIILATILTATTFGIFLMSWVRTERQAGLMIGGFVTIMGMLGMLPIFVLSMPNPPKVVYTLSHVVPQGWAVEGLQIAMEGGAPEDVIFNSLVLLAWSALFFGVGLMRFRKRFA